MKEEAVAEATPPDGWGLVGFDGCVEDPPRRRPSVQQNQYLAAGRFPVVDQGSELVAGFTNDESTAYGSDDLPVIVFGDHTRNLKFVDFPFATGADGTKLIVADRSKLDPKFLFFALLDVKVPSRGYNRHFALLREACIAVPSSKEEQRAIASVLTKIQDAVSLEDKRITALKELKVTTMAKVFREGARGEPREQNEFGEMPGSWRRVAIGQLGEVVTGSTPKTSDPSLYGSEIPFFAPGDLGEDRILTTASKNLSRKGLGVSRSLPREAIMVVCIGSTIGKVATTGVETSATNQQINAIVCSGDYEPAFVHYLMCWNADRIRSHSSPSPVPILTKGAFSRIEVMVPRTRDEQKEIAALLIPIDAMLDVARKRKDVLGALFDSSLHQLMTGQLRVTPLLEREPAHAS